jgi:5-methylcytosine-specific restriction endonuclease McrA
MAKNTNKRISIKWIRDRAKSAYEKKDHCHICSTSEDLELHHTHSLTLLLERWIAKTGRDFSTDEATIANRDEFIENHRQEIYDEVYTLCNRHHVQLHSVYGKAPSLLSAPKQESWIELQRAKHQNGKASVKRDLTQEGSPYAPFICDGEFSEFY